MIGSDLLDYAGEKFQTALDLARSGKSPGGVVQMKSVGGMSGNRK